MNPRRTPVILTLNATPLTSGGNDSERRAKAAGEVRLIKPVNNEYIRR